MPIDYSALAKAPRLLLQVTLKPLQSERFQATGFADLGAARYTLPNGTEKLLVESAQSVANYLESACWNKAEEDLIPELKGLPYVRIDCGYMGKTNTILEFHRLNSPYIWMGEETEKTKTFRSAFLRDLGITMLVKKSKSSDGDKENDNLPGVIDFKRFYRTVFKWDINSLLHGLFLEKVDGRLRITRAISGFIEATDVKVAESGGTKVDRVLPSPKKVGLDASKGFGNVPFHRSNEFVAKEITAFFNLDIALLRGYGLPGCATHLLINLALFKVRKFLSTDLRLRAACDLEVDGGLLVTRPKDFAIPSEEELLDECKKLITECQQAGLFATQPIETEFVLKKTNVEVKLPENAPKPIIPENLRKIVTWSKGKPNKPATLKIKPEVKESPEELGKLLFPDNEAAQTAIITAYENVEADNDNEDSTEELEQP